MSQNVTLDQRNADYQWLLDDPRGRRVLRHILLDITGLFRSTFSTNALTMANAEGSRYVGLRIQDELISASRSGYAQVINEHIQEANHG